MNSRRGFFRSLFAASAAVTASRALPAQPTTVSPPPPLPLTPSLNPIYMDTISIAILRPATSLEVTLHGLYDRPVY